MNRGLLVLFLILSSIFASCAKKAQNTTEAHISLSMISGTVAFPVMLYGAREDGVTESFATFIPANTVAPSKALSNGQWKFGAFLWDGAGDPYTDNLRCDVTEEITLDGGDLSLSLDITAANCAGSDVTPSALVYSDPISLVSCRDLSGVTAAGDSCDGQPLGWSKSFVVGLISYDKTVPGAITTSDIPLISSCVTLSGVSSTQTTNLNIPLGNDGGPFATAIIAFDEPLCAGSSRKIILKSGLGSGEAGKVKAFNDGSYNKIFFTDKGPNDLKFIGSNPSHSCDYELAVVNLGTETVLTSGEATTSSSELSTWTPGSSINFQLKNINVAGDDSVYNLVKLNSEIIFRASDGTTSGTELFKTDGTAAGTVLIKDIKPGSAASWPNFLNLIGSKVYFAADDGSNGSELWQTDGTTGGTTIVKDIYSGASSSNISGVISYNDKLYFSATDGTNGSELWVFDPGVAVSGTNPEMIKDINAGAGASNPSYITACNSKLYFSATDATNGNELWIFDPHIAPSGSNPILVSDLNPGATGSSPNQFLCYDDKVFFSADDGSIGAEPHFVSGVTVTSMGNLATGATSSFPTFKIGHNGIVYLYANNSVNGYEPFIYDIVNTSLTLLKDLVSGATPSNPRAFVGVGEYVYFTAKDPGNTKNLIYRTKGTTASTQIAFDPNPAAATSVLNDMFAKDQLGNLFYKKVYHDGSNYHGDIYLFK